MHWVFWAAGRPLVFSDEEGPWGSVFFDAPPGMTLVSISKEPLKI